MPRDKTASHEKIVAAAMAEFLDKGYEQASMKAIADEVGMTSAALYRHFASKQDMFAALVQPAVEAVGLWLEGHIGSSYDMLAQGDTGPMWDFEDGRSDAGLVLDVMYRQPEAFRLLLFRSAGTPYENYLHDLTELATGRMMEFLADCIARGIPARPITRDEMHMLVSAYFSALVQPIEHGYDRADAEGYLHTMLDFFTPGWRLITGL